MAAGVFRAEWTGGLAQLAPKELTQEERVKKIAWDIFSILCPIIGLWRVVEYAIGFVASLIILPATFSFNQAALRAIEERFGFVLQREGFTCQREFIETPDGVRLEVLTLAPQSANADSPVVICFNPNAALGQQEAEEPLEVYRDLRLAAPCRIVCFNYRGTGESNGKWNRFDDLVIDGASVVQWVRSKMGISPDKIRFYGRSLGGAVAAKVQALDPELTGLHINDRSFTSLEAIIKDLFGSFLGSFLSGILTRRGYVVDAGSALAQIKKKIVWHHPTDQIIPEGARHPGSEPLTPDPDVRHLFNRCHHNSSLMFCSLAVRTQFAAIFGPQPESPVRAV